MSQVIVDTATAIRVRRAVGIQVTIINPTGSAGTIFFDADPNRLNASAPGVAPSGTPLIAGAQVQIENFRGEMWFRAAQITFIEVLP
jgi:hypothetical protein